jgi:hypothetical protein
MLSSKPKVGPLRGSYLFAYTVAFVMLAAGAGRLYAEPIYVPNAFFQLPVTDYVATNMISWETSPPQDGGATGVFYNDPAYTNFGEYIYNCDGTQAAYIFADPGIAIFQDYTSVDSTGGPPSHAFNATFEVGNTYELTAGFLGSTNFGESPGVILQMSLYYRDNSSNMVTVASTNIVYTTNVFTGITNFVQFELDVPPVQPGDAWAGQNIGIQFLSIVPNDVTPGGYWDVGNVQLSSEIYVPNADFELPVTDYVATNMISWETSPPQDDGATGVFYNDPAYTNFGEYIFNCNGTQAAYIFADPGIAIFQDYASVDSTGGPPSRAFDATYDIGKSYQLSAGFIASTNFGESPGVILEMSLYYRDSSSNMVTVAATDIVFETNVFTEITNFVDFELKTPPVQASDPWAGQNIGIQFLSIVPDNVTPGGYWDLGNVELSAFVAPTLNGPSWTGGQFGATLQSDPGLVFQIMATTNLSGPPSAWTGVVTLTNVSGTTSFVDPATNLQERFYQAQQVSPP